jgi:hypothetical protein
MAVAVNNPKQSAVLIQEIAKAGFEHALEILQIIEVLLIQNTGRIKARLADKGAEYASAVVWNGLIARITLLVAGCYSPVRFPSDRHLRVAFKWLKDAAIRAEVEQFGSKADLAEAEKLWSQLDNDGRLEIATHFRNKFTAHIAEPDPKIAMPEFKDFFEFARDTARVMEKLAHGVGATADALDDVRDKIAGGATEFWRPWQ